MNGKLNLLMAVIGFAAALSGCGSMTADQTEENRPWPETEVLSHLNDESSRALAEQLLTKSSGEDQIEVFWDHVDQINRFLTEDELTDGFEEVDIDQTRYDPYDVQARWEAEYPDFPGYNCRITAFSLFQDQIRIGEAGDPAGPDYIMMDLFALESDPSAIPDEAGREKFQTLYAGIETENTRDVSVHLSHLQKSWKERQISFEDGDASLISVVFHDQLDGDRLFIGHTGILYETEENGETALYFLEKIAFQEPYQLVKFSSRSEVSDYLMAKYDVEFNQSAAPPFVLENDQLIEGWRSHEEG